jgi:hypothetical protein
MNKTEKLIKDIESAVGFTVDSPKDFEQLKQRITSRTGHVISTTTLKRIWQYLPNEVCSSRHTLNILSQFLGYKNWEEYNTSSSNNEENESDPLMCRHINVLNDLTTGDVICLTWHPGRVCRIEYLGNQRFKVLYSEKTRLKAGNTFECGLIIENEPLFIDRLVQNNLPPIAYVCGKKTGVRFEINTERG